MDPLTAFWLWLLKPAGVGAVLLLALGAVVAGLVLTRKDGSGPRND